MAIDEELASRVRDIFANKAVATEEKRMMGGLCFMVEGKMCVGVDGNRLMVRLDPAIYEESLKQPGCVPMDFTGKPMRGFIFVTDQGLSGRKALTSWIELALEFNPRAKASKPKHAATNGNKKLESRRSQS